MSYWSVVQTESRREHVAAEYLERAEFKTYFPKILIGSATGRGREASLFPGYLFVEIVDHWWSVRWTVGVVRLLMLNERPAAIVPEALQLIRDNEVDGFVRLPKQATRAKPRQLKNGDWVKMVRGSFENRIGIYQGQSGAHRACILLSLLGREVRALVPTADMARVGA